MQHDKFRLEFLPIFYDDMGEIIDYISITLKNPEAAEQLVDDIFDAIDKRLPLADRFAKYESIHEFRYDYYRINVKIFIVFYVIRDDDPSDKVMEVRRVLYDRRNLQKLI